MKTVITLLFFFVAYSAAGQSAADWQAFKQEHGLPASLSYNTWVAEGCPLPGGGGGPTPAQIEEMRREREARQQDAKGVTAYNSGDFDAAIADFQKGLADNPNDLTLKKHLAEARQTQSAQAQDAQQAAADRRHFQQMKTDVLAEMKGGDFDGLGSGLGLKGLGDEGDASGLKGIGAPGVPAKGGGAAAGSPSRDDANLGSTIVDARNVPSGLPKAVDDAISGAYADAPPGVAERVRKGFEAVRVHDWELAAAWFGDALNHDPGNAGLKHLAALAGYTGQHAGLGSAAGASGSTPAHPAPRLILPKDSDMEYLFPGWKPPAGNAGGGSRLPPETDTRFLFPDLPQTQAREMNDYLMERALEMTENDPVLLRLSGRASPQSPLPPSGGP